MGFFDRLQKFLAKGDKPKELSDSESTIRVWITVLDPNDPGSGPLNDFFLYEGDDKIEIGRNAGHPESNKKKLVTLDFNKILIADNPETQHISKKHATLTWNSIQQGYMIENHSKGLTYSNNGRIDYGPVRHLEQISFGDTREGSPFVLAFVYKEKLEKAGGALPRKRASSQRSK